MSRTLPVAELSKLVTTALARARPSSVADARRAVDAGQLVKISGQTAPGPQGLLTSPFSGTPCVWYRSVTSPFTEATGTSGGITIPRATLPTVVPSSGFAPHQAAPRHESAVQCPDAPFAVIDGGDRIEIDPRDALVDTEVVTYNEYRRDEHGLATALLQEWVLPPGRPVLAFGVPRRTSDPSATALRPDADGILIVATHDEQYLRSRSNTVLPNVKLIISGAVGAGVVVLAVILLVILRVI